MVLLFHAEPDLGSWVHLGYTGVTLFFVLSGFLITGILIDSREAINYFSSFYVRRALRIFPIYYLTIICIFLVVPRIFPTAKIPPEHDRVFYFLYLNNWTRLLHEPNNLRYSGHLWSLAVEEQFYWMWPLIVFKTNNRTLKYISFAGILLGIGTAFYLSHAGASNDSIGRNTLVALPSLMAGALCAIYFRETEIASRIPRFSTAILASAICLTIFFIVASESRFGGSAIQWISGLGLILAFSFFLLSAVLGPYLYRKFLAFAPLRRVGRYSYGMYVYHIPLYTFIDRLHLISPGPVNAAAKMVSAFVLAAFSYEILEKRVNAYKDRFRARYPQAKSSPMPDPSQSVVQIS